uniref:CACTA en-spm transposon protein n=1 Tax=Cucumis melo TaxID=3656 RepID=A0A9I9E901_CUCME
MDKGWMKLRNMFSFEYREGVTQFLEFAKFHVDAYGRIRCPRQEMYELKLDLTRGCGTTSTDYCNLPLLHIMGVSWRVIKL